MTFGQLLPLELDPRFEISQLIGGGGARHLEPGLEKIALELVKLELPSFPRPEVVSDRQPQHGHQQHGGTKSPGFAHVRS